MPFHDLSVSPDVVKTVVGDNKKASFTVDHVLAQMLLPSRLATLNVFAVTVTTVSTQFKTV